MFIHLHNTFVFYLIPLYRLPREDQMPALRKSALKTANVKASQDLKFLNRLIHP